MWREFKPTEITMSNPKKSFYAIIPATVRYCEDLPANAKLLYGEITALCHEQGFCWANNYYFSELYNVSKVSISKWISALQREGFIQIEIDQSQGNSRKIFIGRNVVPSQSKVKEVVKKSLRPSQSNVKDPRKEKFIHNNTINNTGNNTKREARALDFLRSECPSRYEQEFLMKYKSKIKDLEKFEEDFNDTVDQEDLFYSAKVLFARLGKYARNWIQNQDRFKQPANQINYQGRPDLKRIG
jgi:hypothetical protein